MWSWGIPPSAFLPETNAGREVHQEIDALTRGQVPTQVMERDGRQVQVWDVLKLRFTDRYPGAVRGVKVREGWTERRRVGGRVQTPRSG